MRYYRVSEDWITHLQDDSMRAETISILRGLSLERLQKYPPPKLGGLPFGNESRVFLRYVKGESSQLDASALSSFYRSFASERDKLIYRAFRSNETLSREQWAEIIGAENIEKWIAGKFLRETADKNLICRFCIVSLDNLLLAVDPLNDHGTSDETVSLPDKPASDSGDDIQPFHHTYIGQDSLRQIEIMERQEFPSGGRYLDCGPGAGAILLYFSRRHDEAVGIDINARAAKLARFNAELNELKNCQTFEDDALNLGERYGKFDLVSWNLPFIFLPDEWKDNAIDGFGGEMGIGLCLDFIETLPEILSEGGTACIAAVAPILDSGTNVLEERLNQKIGRLKLDCTVIVSQITLAYNKELWDFHKSHGIRKFESVYLNLTHGSGKLQRTEPPATRKVLDAVREKLYQRKFP